MQNHLRRKVNMTEALAERGPEGGQVDPITAEVIMHGLCAIPNLVDKNIARTAYSFLISEYKDYAVGIVDSDGSWSRNQAAACRSLLPMRSPPPSPTGLRSTGGGNCSMATS